MLSAFKLTGENQHKLTSDPIVFCFLVSFTETPEAPDKPEIDDVTSNSMLVTWNEPNDNGSPILGYWVERREINSSHWTRVNRWGNIVTKSLFSLKCGYILKHICSIVPKIYLPVFWMFPSVLVFRDIVPDTELNVEGLLEGLTYIFRVAAENQAGPGKFSPPSEPRTAQAPIRT